MQGFEYVRNFDAAGNIQAPKSNNIVEFFSHAVLDEARSETAGRSIFTDVEMVRIIIPGDLKNIVERKADEEDRRKYARQYEAFQRQEAIAADGTPLEHWPALTTSMVRQLKFFNVFTVEALAGIGDAQMQEMGILGLRSLRERAKAFLHVAATGALPDQVIGENDRLKNEVALLRQQLEAANGRYEELLASKGGDPTAHEPITANVPVTTSSTEGSDAGPGIPGDWKKLGNAALFKLVQDKLGVKVGNRKEAEEVIEEALAE